MASIKRKKIVVASALIGAIIFAVLYVGGGYFVVSQILMSWALFDAMEKYKSVFLVKSKPLLLVWIGWIAVYFVWISRGWGWFLW